MFSEKYELVLQHNLDEFQSLRGYSLRDHVCVTYSVIWEMTLKLCHCQPEDCQCCN